MRPESRPGKNARKIEYNVHIPFAEILIDRIAPLVTHDCRPIGRSDDPEIDETVHEQRGYRPTETFEIPFSLFPLFSHIHISTHPHTHTPTYTRPPAQRSRVFPGSPEEISERRCPAAKIPEGDFHESNASIVSTVCEIASLTDSFFPSSPSYFRFHPLRGVLSLPSGASVARVTAMQRRQEIGEDNRGVWGPIAKQPARG